jgi:hypothetical protein
MAAEPLDSASKAEGYSVTDPNHPSIMECYKRAISDKHGVHLVTCKGTMAASAAQKALQRATPAEREYYTTPYPSVSKTSIKSKDLCESSAQGVEAPRLAATMHPGFPQEPRPPTLEQYAAHKQAVATRTAARDVARNAAWAASPAASLATGGQTIHPVAVGYAVGELRQSGRLLEGFSLDLSNRVLISPEQRDALKQEIRDEVLTELRPAATQPRQLSTPPAAAAVPARSAPTSTIMRYKPKVAESADPEPEQASSSGVHKPAEHAATGKSKQKPIVPLQATNEYSVKTRAQDFGPDAAAVTVNAAAASRPIFLWATPSTTTPHPPHAAFPAADQWRDAKRPISVARATEYWDRKAASSSSTGRAVSSSSSRM